MARRRGNPNWGKAPYVAPASALTEFEKEARRLRLKEHDYAFSDQLRRWCEKNKNHHFIPEQLLKRWNIVVDNPSLTD